MRTLRHFLALTCVAILSTAASAADLALLPDGAMLVVRFNVEQMVSAPIVKSDPKMYDQAMNELGKVLQPYGVDVRKDVKAITLASNETMPQGLIGFLEGQFDTARITGQLESLSQAKKGIQKLAESGATVYKADLPQAASAVPGAPSTLYLSLLDANTIAFAVEKDAVIAAIAQKVGNKKATPSPKLVEQIKAFPKDQSVAIAFAPSSALLAGLPTPYSAMTGITGGLQLNADIQTAFQITVPDAATANELAKSINETLKQARLLIPDSAKKQNGDDPTANLGATGLANLIGTLKAVAEGSSVKVVSTLTRETLNKLGQKQ